VERQTAPTSSSRALALRRSEGGGRRRGEGSFGTRRRVRRRWPRQRGDADGVGSGRPGQPGRQRTSSASSLPARRRTSVWWWVTCSSCGRWRPRCSLFRHSRNGGQPGPPAHRVACFGTWRGGSPTRRAPVFGLVGGARAPLGTDVQAARPARFAPAEWSQDRDAACNQANPMVGCRVQQTCAACAEQTAEVVRNGKGGRSPGVASRGRRLATKPRRPVQRKLNRPHVQSAGHPPGGDGSKLGEDAHVGCRWRGNL
jgi:hypothetical protein